ncbi:MAG: alkaline phosphatase family protein, partial [Candidatus Solibacter usitatus]|nr:alkaline phosphatase family protein [Candidatus Solibacter usitatus]
VLALSLSSNDYVGHAKGPDDPQVRDISIRTDRLLGELFRFVEAKVGMRNVLVVFTADHGVAPVPEVNQARKMPGGRIVEKSLLEVTEKALTAKYGAGKWVEGGTGATQWLNYKLIEEKKLSIVEVSETAAQALRQAPHIIRAYTGDQLRRGALTGDMFDQRVRNGYNSRSGGDVIVVGDPYYIYDSKGTSHGMPYQYDAHVPVIFMGEAIKGGRYQKRIMVNDIAPTLSTLLEVETPSGSVGRALDEILK